MAKKDKFLKRLKRHFFRHGKKEDRLSLNRIMLLVLIFGFVFSLSGCQGNLSLIQKPQDTNHELIKKAQECVIEGLNFYELGNDKEAKQRFDLALNLLSKADLPPGHKDLELLEIGLPERYKRYKLSQIYSRLRGEKVDKPRLAEKEIEESREKIRLMDETIVIEELMEDIEKQKKAEAAQKEVTYLSDDEYIKNEIVRLMAEFGEDEYVVPDIFISSVKHFINVYQTDEREFFEKALRKSVKYLPLIKTIFAQKRVPEDMAYMALVESGFNPLAVSRARAKGLWQFIRSTGRIYGLRSNRYIEERYDPIKSTLAARKYFLDLVAIFGSRSFMLAMASYNAGEMRIQGCLKRLDDPFEQRNFWSIRNCLRKETQDYVPRIIASAIIGKNPKRFGFFDPNDGTKFETVILNRQITLEKIAKISNVSIDTIRKLNPDMDGNSKYTPSRVRNFLLAVPYGTKQAVERELTRIHGKSYALKDITDSYQNRVKYDEEKIRYRVRSGDSLSKIGKKFGVNYKLIAKWNNLPNYRIRTGQVLTIYKGGKIASYYKKEKEVNGNGELRYTVRRGDSLWEIGKKFNVNYKLIADWNDLSGHRIKPGQILTIYRGSPASTIEIAKKVKKGKNLIRYEVEKGNSLYDIGQMFFVHYRDIMRWNNLSSARIYPGTQLKIYTDKNAKLIYYKVKEGDTLSDISKKHNVNLSHLLSYNGLSPKEKIIPKDKLKIYIIED